MKRDVLFELQKQVSSLSLKVALLGKENAVQSQVLKQVVALNQSYQKKS